MQRDIRKTPPPHSAEAEQAVLGALLNDNAALDRCSDILMPEAWYHGEYRQVFDTISRLVMAAKPADIITVHEAGGHDLQMLAELGASVVSSANVRRYAEIIVERWRERQVMRIGAELVGQVQELAQGEAVAGVIDAAVMQLLQVGETRASNEPVGIDRAVSTFLDALQDRVDGKTDAMRTGIGPIDKATSGGIRPGELWVVGARPSMGKTAITLTVSRCMARDYSVLFLTQEDSIEASVTRQVASEGRISLTRLRGGNLSDEEWGRLSEAVESLRTMNLRVDDQGALTLMDVRRKAQQVKRKHGLHVVVIDYLQLMTGDGDNRNQQLGQIANGLKATAKEFGIGIILLSQLNREAEKRAGVPQMGDLRESGDIEGAADVILLLHREYMRTQQEQQKHWAQVHIAKQKNGPTGVHDLFFDGAFQTFRGWDVVTDGQVPRGIKRGASYSGGMD